MRMEVLKKYRNTIWVRPLSSLLVLFCFLGNVYSLQAQREYGGRGVNIAVFDAGYLGLEVYAWYQKLKSEGRIKGEFNLVGSGDIYQYSDHGTAVFSIIAGNEDTLLGSAPEANFYLFITEDVSKERLEEEYHWGRAMEIADSLGVQIINSSLSYTEFDESSENHKKEELNGRTAPISLFALEAARRGMLVVSSAGNYRNDAWQEIGFPADADSILSVGAIDKDGNLASFSSFTRTTDGRQKPEVVDLGVSVDYYGFSGLTRGNGTSFSAPKVSGFVARLLEAHPEAKAQELREAVIKGSSLYPNNNLALGYGVPEFEDAKFALEMILQNKGGKGPLSLFPNPVKTGEVLGLTGISEKTQVMIFDLAGRVLVPKQNLEQNKIELPYNLRPGHYIIAFSAEGEADERRSFVVY